MYSLIAELKFCFECFAMAIASIRPGTEQPHSTAATRNSFQNVDSSRSDVGWPLRTMPLDLIDIRRFSFDAREPCMLIVQLLVSRWYHAGRSASSLIRAR